MYPIGIFHSSVTQAINPAFCEGTDGSCWHNERVSYALPAEVYARYNAGAFFVALEACIGLYAFDDSRDTEHLDPPTIEEGMQIDQYRGDLEHNPLIVNLMLGVST